DQGGFFGGVDKIISIQRQVKVKSPQNMSERLIDGSERRAGDLVCKIAYSQLQAAHRAKDNDPDIIVNGVKKTLAEVRPFLAQLGSNNNIRWGIDLGDDTLSIGGDEWLIVGIEAELWLNGEPSRFTLRLRK
ncbi:MAG: hypothetical protein J6T08_00690, partial [Lentisphaeria bacterium]|nr:hypothetical protein [Lentisphaeria bacterium]